MWRAVLASGNAGKLAELRALLADLPLELVSQRELGVADAEETAPTFIENALLKARHAARVTGLPALADDSGIAVDALGGAPGVHSARYAGVGASDAENLALLLERTATLPMNRRQCEFMCVIVYLRHAGDPCPVISTGRWRGVLATTPRGTNGFGYDPIFLPADGKGSSAELPAAVKNAISHRGQAVAALREQLRAVITI
ncbi:MAG: RdgB/HAM1 family non-canonical purine NTP pyrophosphatase [Gammaproteobacteria bacterium]|nr:RdgB/HAM1 family non-canonical purine NTP pyrophosphatase [Gammaproteobacteria bacterium]